MVSYEGRRCLRPKEMEPRPVKEEEDFSHQEKLEKKGTRTFFPSSQWVAAQVSTSWPDAPPVWCWW